MITLSRGEQQVLAFLLRKAAIYGPENCWPKRWSIAKDLGVKSRTATRRIASLVAFGAIKRIGRGPASTKYRILWNQELLKEQIGSAFPRDVSAFGSALSNSRKVKQIRLVKPEKAAPIGSASPSICPPTPPRTTDMQMPDYYRTSEDQKLWRMAARWIAQNNPDLSVYPDRCAPIMTLLEAAGALSLPEDAELPAINWPPEATPKPVRQEIQPTPRKPMGIAESDLEALRQKIEGQK